MTDKEIEAGIERACECDCAPPSTGWTVNPFPIIRDYIERIKRRAEVAERALLNMTKKYNLAERKIATTKDGWFSFGEAQIALLANEAIKEAEKELAEEG